MAGFPSGRGRPGTPLVWAGLHGKGGFALGLAWFEVGLEEACQRSGLGRVLASFVGVMCWSVGVRRVRVLGCVECALVSVAACMHVVVWAFGPEVSEGSRGFCTSLCSR